MDMPTPCPLCGEICELNDMYPMPKSKNLCCKECYEELEGESHDN